MQYPQFTRHLVTFNTKQKPKLSINGKQARISSRSLWHFEICSSRIRSRLVEELVAKLVAEIVAEFIVVLVALWIMIK